MNKKIFLILFLSILWSNNQIEAKKNQSKCCAARLTECPQDLCAQQLKACNLLSVDCLKIEEEAVINGTLAILGHSCSNNCKKVALKVCGKSLIDTLTARCVNVESATVNILNAQVANIKQLNLDDINVSTGSAAVVVNGSSAALTSGGASASADSGQAVLSAPNSQVVVSSDSVVTTVGTTVVNVDTNSVVTNVVDSSVVVDSTSVVTTVVDSSVVVDSTSVVTTVVDSSVVVDSTSVVTSVVDNSVTVSTVGTVVVGSVVVNDVVVMGSRNSDDSLDEEFTRDLPCPIGRFSVTEDGTAIRAPLQVCSSSVAGPAFTVQGDSLVEGDLFVDGTVTAVNGGNGPTGATGATGPAGGGFMNYVGALSTTISQPISAIGTTLIFNNALTILNNWLLFLDSQFTALETGTYQVSYHLNVQATTINPALVGIRAFKNGLYINGSGAFKTVTMETDTINNTFIVDVIVGEVIALNAIRDQPASVVNAAIIPFIYPSINLTIIRIA